MSLTWNDPESDPIKALQDAIKAYRVPVSSYVSSPGNSFSVNSHTHPEDWVGDFPLAIGEVYGFRTWHVDKWGFLHSVLIKSYVWTPGINLGKCHAADTTEFTRVQLGPLDKAKYTTSEKHYTMGPNGDISCYITVQKKRPIPLHRSPSEECMCGFYGYNNPSHKGSYVQGTIGGVIKGTGRTMIGKKGFRSQNAEIVAILIPSDNPLIGSTLRWNYPGVRMCESVEDLVLPYPEIKFPHPLK